MKRFGYTLIPKLQCFKTSTKLIFLSSIVRLFGSSTENKGRIEVYINSQWGTVCDDMFDATDATVACRELGYSSGIPIGIFRLAILPGTGPILMDDVQCDGSEDSLLECPHSGAHNCQHYEDVGVRCTE